MSTSQPPNQHSTSASATATTAPPTSKPPVSLPNTSHLDPNAYVRGTNQISIGQHVVIHPRSHISSEIGPILIGDGSLISEKCVVGGVPQTTPSTTVTGSKSHTSNGTIPESDAKQSPDSFKSHGSSTLNSSEPGKIQIGQNVHIHPCVHIYHTSTIASYAVLESNVIVGPNVTVGQHSKICANITLSPGTVIPDYTVVYGDSANPQQRRRLKDNVAEEGRLKVFEREREGSMVLLRQTALKTLSSSGSTRKK